MQEDTAYFKGRIAPFNTKHALVDPSHTFTMPKNHHTRRDMDFFDYNRKKKENTCRKL